MMEDNHIEIIDSLIERHDITVKSNIKEDKLNIFLLLILYTLQGVPLGFSLAIPVIIQNVKSSSYSQQAGFSLAVWPYSLKILWAPLVDSIFIRKLGRRKSWLIPLQYLLGIFIIITGRYLKEWLLNTNERRINVLTLMFFILNFLVATQDIVVDGWALSRLKRKNVNYSAMCNSTGQVLGMFLGYNLLIILVSETFWNTWWRSSPLPYGVITLQGYFYFWGVTYFIVTTLIAYFTYENDCLNDSDFTYDGSIVKTYKLLFSLFTLPNIKRFAIILITIKLSFSIDSAFKLKLIDGGVSKGEIATIESFFFPLRLILPFLITEFTSKEKPLQHYFNIIPYRLLVGVVFTIIIYFTPYFLVRRTYLLLIYKILLVVIFTLQQLLVSSTMLMATAFYAIICDPKIGGTNMTLFTTISNIGTSSANSATLWFIDFLTFKQCSKDHTNSCSSESYQKLCSSSGGTCQVTIDGFYVATVICTIYGVLWYFTFRKSIINLQSKNVNEWHVKIKKKEII